MASHLLRPEFTEMLADRLRSGSNLNLSGAHGQGRRRTLEDLRHTLRDSMHVHQFDFRRERMNPLNWLAECEFNSGQALIILHNFNEMEANESTRTFLDRLSRLCNRPDISLLCITECEAQNLLGLESFQLPPLSDVSRKATTP
jgi:hypothetical protein